MQNDELKRTLSARLGGAAAEYLAMGLRRFHDGSRPSDGAAQAVIGALGTAVELAVKSFLARMNPVLVFKELSREAQACLAAPADASGDFNWKPTALDLADFAFETVDLKEAARALWVFFPAQKQALRPYFRLLGDLHRPALERSLAKVKPFELEKTVYLALALAQLLTQDGRAGFRYEPDARDRRFLEAYEAARKTRVEDRLREARRKAKTLKPEIAYNEPGPPEGWDAFEARCPVCKNWGVLEGSTDIRCEGPEGEEEYLDFAAETFDCDACGLRLEDAPELELADLPVVYDRSSDLKRWRDEPGS
jgi:hypothetical protein